LPGKANIILRGDYAFRLRLTTLDDDAGKMRRVGLSAEASMTDVNTELASDWHFPTGELGAWLEELLANYSVCLRKCTWPDV